MNKIFSELVISESNTDLKPSITLGSYMCSHIYWYLRLTRPPSLSVSVLSTADREGCVLMLLLSVYKSVFVQRSIMLQGNSRCSPAHLYPGHTKLLHVDTATVTYGYKSPIGVHFRASANPQAAAEASGWILVISHC